MCLWPAVIVRCLCPEVIIRRLLPQGIDSEEKQNDNLDSFFSIPFNKVFTIVIYNLSGNLGMA